MSTETVSADDVDWEALAHVTSSKYREQSIRHLHNTPDNPTGIAREHGSVPATYAHALSDLEAMGLVTPAEDLGDGHETYYRLTNAGEAVQRALDGDINDAPGSTEPSCDWDHIGFVDASKSRRIVLERLAVAPATPKRITDSNDDIAIADVSHALRQLRDHGLVELLVDEDRRKGRYYGLTDLGRSVAIGLKEVAP